VMRRTVVDILSCLKGRFDHIVDSRTWYAVPLCIMGHCGECNYQTPIG
jgi:hypothetical protein